MTVIGFDSPYPAALRQVTPTDWILLEDLIYTASKDTYVVPAGFHTDFASVPSPLQALFPRVGTYSDSVCLHDYAWRVLAPTGQIGYRDADGLLRQALKTQGVGRVRRFAMWAAVRLGALLTRRNGWRGWYKDAPLVLGISLLALPFAVPAAFGALPGLFVLWLSDRF